VIGPKEPCRVRYRRRTQPSVTMAMGTKMAEVAQGAGGVEVPQAVQQAAAAAGCPAHAAKPASASPEPARSMKVRIDRDLCQGHAVCASEAPEVFAISPNDQRVMLKVAKPGPELHAKVRAAAGFCPNSVIKIEEE